MRDLSKYKSKLFGLACATAVLATPVAGIAATATTTFTVSATVQSICAVNATPLSFGSYDASAASPNDATSTVTATCSNSTVFDVSLDEGLGSALVTTRKMTNGGNTLSYNMYTTSARNTIWGNGTIGSATQSGVGDGTGQVFTVYGRIPQGQYVTPGGYSDTVTATVTY